MSDSTDPTLLNDTILEPLSQSQAVVKSQSSNPVVDNMEVTLRGELSQRPISALPEDVRKVVESVDKKDIVVVRHKNVSGFEALNHSHPVSVSMVFFDPWHFTHYARNPTRKNSAVVISPTLNIHSDGPFYDDLKPIRRHAVLTMARRLLKNIQAEDPEIHELSRWIEDRAKVWSPMHIARCARAKYALVANSPELADYRASKQDSPFVTPSRLRKLTYDARRSVEHVRGTSFGLLDCKTEAAQAASSRHKLGLLEEMEGDEDERGDGEDLFSA
ncbi:hypothetical protein OF83DRAFT_1175915 [Amylostereum chailletii]|nr:hypothetical protein OF83DRAFT_1175915 [Amylostereum chailletii]